MSSKQNIINTLSLLIAGYKAQGLSDADIGDMCFPHCFRSNNQRQISRIQNAPDCVQLDVYVQALDNLGFCTTATKAIPDDVRARFNNPRYTISFLRQGQYIISDSELPDVLVIYYADESILRATIHTSKGINV